MSDINHFDDYLIDSFEIDGCLWRRLEGRARQISVAIKRMTVPAAAAMAMGAAVFATPGEVWASDYSSVRSTNSSQAAQTVSKFETSHEHSSSSKTKASDKEDWAAGEVSRLRKDLFSALDRYKAGDTSSVSQSVLDFAKEVSMSNQSDAVALLGKSMDQSDAVHQVSTPPHSVKRIAKMLKVLAS